MVRFAVSLAVLLILFVQALAPARAGLIANAPAEPGHAWLHWQGKAHHHHDDGSYQVDDSNQSVWHLLAEQGNFAVVLFESATPPALPATASPGHFQRLPGASPFLAGPLRPPRAAA